MQERTSGGAEVEFAEQHDANPEQKEP